MSKKQSKRRIICHGLFGFTLLIVGVLGCIKVLSYTYDYTSTIILSENARESNKNISEMTLRITPQTTLKELAQLLADQSFVSNALYFRIEAKLNKVKEPLNSGQYSISSNMSSNEILEMLTTDITSEKETIKFMIPEGYNIVQIAAKLENEGIVSESDFLNAVQERDYDYTFLKNMPSDSKYKLEGYLFPDTYIIRKDATPEEIIIKMLNRFNEIFSKYKAYINTSYYDLHEILTIASMIESEAKLDEERSIISGVIYNRLDTGMKLQMCSTVQYLLEKRKANLSYDDLGVDSPYNTYQYAGLPIGPICNPGEAAIAAALSPEAHDYYYFVVKDASIGSHSFSSTATEHANAKKRYQQSVDKNFID